MIDRILAGDQDGYATLVDRYKSFAFSIAVKVLNNRAEAEEVAQDAFVKAFYYLKNFNKQSKFSTWLYRIVFNTALSHKRKNRVVMDELDQQTVAYHEHADHALERNDKQQYVAQALQLLSDADREAVQLYYLRELSLEETAEVLGLNLNTLKVRVHRARQRLAEELRKLLKEEALTL